MASHFDIQVYKDIFKKASTDGEKSLNVSEKTALEQLNDAKFQSLLEVIEKEKTTQPDSPLLKSGGDYYEFITAYEKVKETINSKNTLSDATKSKLSALKQQVPVPQTVGVTQVNGLNGVIVTGTQKKEITHKEALESIKDKKPELNKSLEVMSMENLENSLKLTENLLKLAPSSHTTLARGLAGSMMLGRLQELGYHVSLMRDKKVIVTSSNKDAKDVENKINTFLATPNSSMLDIIRVGILYMSPTFQQYSESKSKDGIITLPQTPEEYKKYLDAKYKSNTSKLSEDKLFIDSFNKGGYNGYDLTVAMMQSKDLDKVATFVGNNPAIVSQIQQAPSITPAITPTNIPAPVPTLTSAPSTTAGKAAGVVGEGIGTVAGGIGSLVGTVAAETGSTWSTILSEATKTGGAMGAIGVIGLLIGSIWKFGFWKTMMGVVGVGGASALVNAAEDGTLDKAADKLRKGGDKLGGVLDKITGEAAPSVAPSAAIVAPAVTVAGSINKSGLSEYQKSGVLSIENNKSLLEDIANYPKQAGKDKQNADLSTYINTLHKDSIQNITLDKLIYTTDQEYSIFSDTIKSQFGDNKDIPDTISRYLLKKTIRSYIGINTSLSMPTNNQKEGQQSLDDFKKKFPEDQWKNKTLKDLLNEVYKK